MGTFIKIPCIYLFLSVLFCRYHFHSLKTNKICIINYGLISFYYGTCFSWQQHLQSHVWIVAISSFRFIYFLSLEILLIVLTLMYSCNANMTLLYNIRNMYKIVKRGLYLKSCLSNIHVFNNSIVKNKSFYSAISAQFYNLIKLHQIYSKQNL